MILLIDNYDSFTYNASISTASGTLKKISGADDILTLKLYYDVSATPIEPGDTVRCEIDGIGSLTNTVR